MPAYFYIIILAVISAVLLGMAMFYRSRVKHIYNQFKDFSGVVISGISELKDKIGGSRKNTVITGNNYRDLEGISKLINSFSAEYGKNAGILDLLTDNIKQGFLLVDGNKNIVRINRSLSDLFYLDPQKAIGKKTVLVFNSEKLEGLISKVLETGLSLKEEIVFYGDEDLHLDIEAVPFKFTDNKSQSKTDVLILVDNITQEVEFSKLRSQFVANISHEMRTPLTSIKGYIETALESDSKEIETIKKYLAKGLKEAEKLNLLIKEILDLSRIEYRRNVLFEEDKDLTEIIRDVIRSLDFLAGENGVKIHFEDPQDNIYYRTDEELFRQLVRNIIENSIFYAGSGSQLNIRLKKCKYDILLEFSDNGMGIKKEDLPFIFQRFFRGKPASFAKRIGSGLGLSIVKHTVDLHGGKIDVESKPGSGTKFRITLPAKSTG
jgi:two-component system, OmpR family, phosphate regulon sensor histidine kinase PhoR